VARNVNFLAVVVDVSGHRVVVGTTSGNKRPGARTLQAINRLQMWFV